MGKRNFAKLLVTVPLTVSMVMNPTVIPKKEKLEEEVNQKTRFYSVDDKFKQVELNKISFEVKEGFWNTKLTDKSREEKIQVEKASVSKKEMVLNDNANKTWDELTVYSKMPEKENKHFEKIKSMIGNYPMAKMLPYLEKQDPLTAAFLVAIAKKESNWGKVSPRSKEGDCFNYWGFKDRRFKFVAGHSCFPSAEVAVETVGKRIDNLVAKGKDTPGEMVIWKCGSACSGDKGAGKWISDVNLYFKPIVALASL